MASNRLSYDECQHSQRTTERTNPLNYMMYAGKFLPSTSCAQKSELSFCERVNIENDVWNLQRKNTKCDGGKYQTPCAEWILSGLACSK